MGDIDMKVNVTSNREAYQKAADQAIEQALIAVGMQAEGYAKNELSNNPRRIDTGLLRNSITYALAGKPAAIGSYHASYGSNRTAKGNRRRASSKNAGSVGYGSYGGQAPSAAPGTNAVYIGTNVKYATYVHNGTSRMAANRFLRNAVTRNGSKFAAIIKKYLQSG